MKVDLCYPDLKRASGPVTMTNRCKQRTSSACQQATAGKLKLNISHWKNPSWNFRGVTRMLSQLGKLLIAEVGFYRRSASL